MKVKLYFGITIAAVVAYSLLTIGYHYRYQVAKEKAQLPKNPIHESVEADGYSTKNEGFYLRNQNGFIVVYLSDNKTVYEYTSISIDSLPQNIKEQLTEGIFIESEEALFGFLENYTS